MSERCEFRIDIEGNKFIDGDLKIAMGKAKLNTSKVKKKRRFICLL